jgi:hypothetical protein
MYLTEVGWEGKSPGRSDDRDSNPGGGGNFSLRYRVHKGSGAHPVSYPMGSGGSIFEDKVAEA